MPSILTGVLAVICAVACRSMARDLGKKGYVAFFIGISAGLFGLFGYIIYWRIGLRYLKSN